MIEGCISKIWISQNNWRVLGIREETADEIRRIPYVRRLQKAVQNRTCVLLPTTHFHGQEGQLEYAERG